MASLRGALNSGSHVTQTNTFASGTNSLPCEHGWPLQVLLNSRSSYVLRASETCGGASETSGEPHAPGIGQTSNATSAVVPPNGRSGALARGRSVLAHLLPLSKWFERPEILSYYTIEFVIIFVFP